MTPDETWRMNETGRARRLLWIRQGQGDCGVWTRDHFGSDFKRGLLIQRGLWSLAGESGADMAALASSLASLTITPLSSTVSSRSSASAQCRNGASLLRIECSSHPQKKATAHHNKTRPKKRNPYDKNRKGPTVYKRLPEPPPVWGFDTSDLDETEGAATPTEASAPPA